MKKPNNLPETVSPGINEVIIYFSQRGLSIAEADHFFKFYEKRGWKSKKGLFLRKWKNTAYQWIFKILKREPWLFNKAIH
jgi:hypothetical protein